MQPNQPSSDPPASGQTPARTRRPAFLAVSLAVLAFLIGGLGLILAEFRGLSPVVDGQPIGNLGYIVKDGYTTMDVLDAGAGRLVLVDAGNDPDGVAIRASLAAHDQRPEQVAAILLTHGHPDHVAAAHLFPDAKIYGMAAEAMYLEGQAAFNGPLPRLFGAKDSGVRLTRGLHDGESVTVGDLTARVYAVPGHTAGSAAWLVEHVIFLGDSGSASEKGQLLPAPWIFSDDVAENTASLQTLAVNLQAQEVVLDRIVMSHTGMLPGAALRVYAYSGH